MPSVNLHSMSPHANPRGSHRSAESQFAGSEFEDRSRQFLTVDSLIGAVICVLAAVSASLVAAGHPWEVFVPLVFSIVILLVALIFGARAGFFGTLLAAVVFAFFLFSPTGKIQVASDVARTNLGWMLLIGIAFSFLFAPPTSGLHRR